MAGTYADPPANMSNNVSPVSASEDPDSYLTSVAGDGIDTLITAAYDLVAYAPFRRQLAFSSIAVTRPTRQSHVGATVTLNVVGDLDDDPATAALDESYDVLPTPLASWNLTVAMAEYGRTVTKTALARGQSMIPLDPTAAERVGRNMGATYERLAYNALVASGGITNTGGAGGAVEDVTVANSPSDTLRAASQEFKEDNVEPYENGLYRAYLTPASETALRKEADAAGWRYWQINQDSGGGTGSIARGYVGVYEGFEIVVSNLVGAGLGGIFVGNEALAKIHSTAPGFGPEPQVVVAPVVDRLKRFASIGWYWLGGYARFRAEAVLTGDLTATS
jgi:N4-gp56 family major capsid protein